jgi:threonine dehydratase
MFQQISDELVDGMVTVTNDEVCAAIKMCFNDTRCVLEPAGALGIAGEHFCLSVCKLVLKVLPIISLGTVCGGVLFFCIRTSYLQLRHWTCWHLHRTSLPLGMVKYAQQGGITGRTMVAVTSGANMDFDRCECMLRLLLTYLYACAA